MCGCRRPKAPRAPLPTAISCKIVQWRATVDELAAARSAPPESPRGPYGLGGDRLAGLARRQGRTLSLGEHAWARVSKHRKSAAADLRTNIEHSRRSFSGDGAALILRNGRTQRDVFSNYACACALL